MTVIRQREARGDLPLTTRQLECVRLVGRGKTDWEISQMLGITEGTVTSHINEARRRNAVTRRAELPVQALFRGDLEFSDLIDVPASAPRHAASDPRSPNS